MNFLVSIILLLTQRNLLIMTRSKNLVSIFLLTVISIACDTGAAQEPASTRVSASEFKDLMEQQNGQIVDVRTPEEYQQGYIPGAQLANVMEDHFRQQVDVLDREKALLLYCRSGNRSQKASQILKEMGFKNIYDLETGITGWKSNGYPVKK